jgi:hypothetical protein
MGGQVRLLYWSSKSGKNSSCGVLSLQRCTFSKRRPVFSYVVCCNGIALRKILLQESRAKTHQDTTPFKKCLL